MKRIEKTGATKAHQKSTVAIASLLLGLINFVLLALLVVPRLYGMDPLGLEHGLKLSRTDAVDKGVASKGFQPNAVIGSQQGVGPSLRTVVPSNQSQNQIAVDPFAEQHAVATLVVPPGQDLNYWLSMTRDCELEYHWSTNGSKLGVEFRGERTDAKPGEYKTFGKSMRSKVDGLFIAPFSGKFGWHWSNTSRNPVTIKLIASGKFQVPGQ